jgi:hypothetical protein
MKLLSRFSPSFAWCAVRFAVLLFAMFFSPTSYSADVTTDGFKIFVDGKKMVIKGMNYSPVPIGTVPGKPPYGDYFVPNYRNVWKPDLAMIRAAGINAIKLYAGDPRENADGAGTYGNWKQFLDECYNNGTNPIYVVMFSYVQGGEIAAGGQAYQRYLEDYEMMVKSTIRHPAVLGYCIGNEIFDRVANNQKFWTNFGALVDRADRAGVSMNCKPFLMTAITDNYTPQASWPAIKEGEKSGKLSKLDAWGLNVYRGPKIGGEGNSPFTQYKALMTSLKRSKPFILAEWGTPHSTRPQGTYGKAGGGVLPINLDSISESEMGKGKPYFDATTTGKFLSSEWNTIKTNIAAKDNQVCVGGFIFDWCDEYWKGNDPNNHVGGPDQAFKGDALAGSYYDEAWFGVTSAVAQSDYGSGKPDIKRTPYKAYDAVKEFYGSSSSLAAELY